MSAENPHLTLSTRVPILELATIMLWLSRHGVPARSKSHALKLAVDTIYNWIAAEEPHCVVSDPVEAKRLLSASGNIPTTRRLTEVLPNREILRGSLGREHANAAAQARELLKTRLSPEEFARLMRQTLPTPTKD